MNWPFPLNAPEISVKWHQDECGLGIIAMTDEAGRPYIGLYPLDFEGIACGQPIYFQRQRLIADILVGFSLLKPIVAYIDADVSMRGLDVRLCSQITNCRIWRQSIAWNIWAKPRLKSAPIS